MSLTPDMIRRQRPVIAMLVADMRLVCICHKQVQQRGAVKVEMAAEPNPGDWRIFKLWREAVYGV